MDSPMDLRTLAERLGPQWLAHVSRLTRAALRTRVEQLPPTTSRTAGYHFGWLDARGAPVDAPSGKYVRPVLVFACAEAVGGRASDAVPAAAATELVHGATLLHDDIIDEDTFRHHRATTWHALGRTPAMLAGDALLAQAFRTLTDGAPAHLPRSVAVLGDVVAEMAEGEALDVAFESRADVTLDEYATMATAKSGALTGAACELGALAGGADPERAALLAAFGRHLGLAGQITDDLLGLYGDPDVTGKPAGSDVASAKKSYPVLAALASPGPAGRRLRALYARPGGPGTELVAEATELITEAGGREHAEAAAAAQAALAATCLDKTALPPDATARLTTLAAFVHQRTL